VRLIGAAGTGALIELEYDPEFEVEVAIEAATDPETEVEAEIWAKICPTMERVKRTKRNLPVIPIFCFRVFFCETYF